MFFLGITYLIFLALFLTAMFSYGFRMRGPWGSFWSFFAIIFLVVWASDVWVTLFGPYWNEVYWFPPLVVGVLVALLMASVTPRTKPPQGTKTHPPATRFESEAVAVTVGSIFWLLLVLLILSIVIGLFND